MHYYEAFHDRTGGYFAIVYHYEADGRQRVIDFRTDLHDTAAAAEDAAVSWCDDHDIEVELA